MVAIKNIFVRYIKLRSRLDNGKIYKITDNSNDNVYIGSTCKTLNERLLQHKYDYKRFLKGLFPSVKSFDIIKNDDYNIELLENCDIKTKQELIARERFFIENNDSLNKYIPGRSHKEYYNENKDELTIKKKEKLDCQCGGRYTRCGKARHQKTTKYIKYLESLK